jgi:hypothetical protein
MYNLYQIATKKWMTEFIKILKVNKTISVDD